MPSISLSIKSPNVDWSVTFKEPEILIGRGGENQIHLRLPDPMASRMHGKLWLCPDGFWYEDTNSTHGSQLNGDPLKKPMRVHSGDVLILGESRLTIVRANISDDDLDLDELFDVHIRDRIHLSEDQIGSPIPYGQIKVLTQQSSNATTTAETKIAAAFFGKMANDISCRKLSEGLPLVIKDIVSIIEQVERSVILLNESNGQELIVSSCYPAHEAAFSTTLIKKTLEEKKAFIWESHQNPVLSESTKRLNIKAGLYSPLTFGPQQLGVLCADSTSPEANFTDEDLSLFVSIAQVLSALILAKRN